MILKEFELNKINLKNHNFYLLHGNNEGLKKEIISNLNFKIKSHEFQTFEEKQILENQDWFIDEIFSGSLFSNEKLIIINHASDKILKIIEYIYNKNIHDLIIIINTNALDKKSKLRNFFEKQKEFICIAIYPDTPQILSMLISKFFRERKISISQLNINLIVSKCNGDREILKNELNKIELYLFKKENINSYQLSKLINLIENHSISELVDSCLLSNTKKIVMIINENNFSSDDCIMILRAFLAKTKKILTLANIYKKNNDLDKTISEAKPAIFWKEKDLVKQQLQKQKPDFLKKIIFDINQTELKIKKNSQSSVNILMNFIFEQISAKA